MSIPQVSYLTTDHLGSPRVITDANGNVTSRKDFSAFGDETITSQRNAGLGYQPKTIRQDYTGYQKDDESGLEFAQARYYNTQHGRFTSVDPLTASATIKDPQSFNRYSYVLNSPYKFTDPLGLIGVYSGACGSWCQGSGPYLDGSDFRGTDDPLDWAREYYGNVVGYALDQPESPSCSRGHMCFGEQAQQSNQTTGVMSPSEEFLAKNFGGPGAYFSNPNDGDPVDQTKGIARNPATSRSDPENHLYPSMTDANAQSGFYVPDGGKYAGETTYTESSGQKVRVILIHFANLGELKNVTVAVYHLININISMPKGADGRRKLGDLGTGAGGAPWSYVSKDATGKRVVTYGIHAHLEIYQGKHTSLPSLPKPHFNFNGVVK